MQVYLMAAVGALSLATLYYNQPLLPLIGASFGLDGPAAGLVVVLTQIGYAAGLFLFVPLGDRFDRRRLITVLLLVNAASLVACAAAPGFAFFAAASIAAGLTTVTPQIIIPAVAGAAPPERRGRTVGILLTGMSVGLLLGRTLSGFVGDFAGWRGVFAMAAGVDLALIAVVWRFFPASATTTDLPYLRLLRSIWRLFVEQPALRAACATGFLTFAGTSAVWATLAPLLALPPHQLGARAAGLFGLVAIAAILATPFAGRITDRLGSGTIISLGLASVAAGFLFVGAAGSALWVLVPGLCLIEIGNRAVAIGNQTRIYPLQAGAHSRLNTAFMTSVFVGGAAGSACGAVAAAWGGWIGVGIAGGSFALLGLCVARLTAPTR